MSGSKTCFKGWLSTNLKYFGNENKTEKRGIISNKKCFTVTKPVKDDCSNHLNIKQVWYSNGPNVCDCPIVRVSNGGLKTVPKMSVLWSKIPGI